MHKWKNLILLILFQENSGMLAHDSLKKSITHQHTTVPTVSVELNLCKATQDIK